MSESRLFGDESTTDSSYRRLFELSEGGMGKVELAVRTEGRFRRLYAVKRLQPALRSDASAQQMFVEEARLAGLIHSPNVVGVLDVGEDAYGPFLVMEYIDGVTVRDVILDACREALLLDVQLCCRIIGQAARGLEAAHALAAHDGSPLNLVHRDISPHNILVGFDGVARVADFGIARALGRAHKTSTGILKGKLGYMAPETLKFESPDARSDIFALGVVLFEMLTSRRLYGGADAAKQARRIVEEPPPELADHREDSPPALEALLMCMLAKDRAHRPEHAGIVAQALESIVLQLALEEGPVRVTDHMRATFTPIREQRQLRIGERIEEVARASPRLGTEAKSTRIFRRRGFVLLAAAALVGIALGGAVIMYFGGLVAGPSSEPPEVSSIETPQPSTELPAPSTAEAAPDPPAETEPEPATEQAPRPEVDRPRRRRPRRRRAAPRESSGAATTTPPSWGFDRQ